MTVTQTFGARITLGSSASVEFGQGIAQTTNCTVGDFLTVTPNSGYQNGSLSTSFFLTSFSLSHVPHTCWKKSFLFQAYDASGSLVPIDGSNTSISASYQGGDTSGTGTITNTSGDENTYGGFTLAINTPVAPVINVYKIVVQSSNESGACGLTASSPGKSAFQIHHDCPSQPSGLYWIKNPQINSGIAVQIYADMNRNGGGWTLIVANSDNGGWNAENVLSRNPLTPPLNPADLSADQGHYSILSWADALKSEQSNFEYRIEATNYGAWGGIWAVHHNYSFVDRSNTNSDIDLVQKFDDWIYRDEGIEQHMPYVSTECGLLTTSTYPGGQWWGTIVNGCGIFGPVPWINGQNSNPGIIWYWVR